MKYIIFKIKMFFLLLLTLLIYSLGDTRTMQWLTWRMSDIEAHGQNLL